MKILLVTQYFWPEHFLVNGLSQELVERGHQVSVLTGLPNYPKGNFFEGYSFWKGPWHQDYEGARIFRVPLFARRTGFAFLALNYFSFVVFGVLFGLRAAPAGFDVIFCFAPSPITTCIPAIFLRWLRRKPLVLWVQDLWPESIAAVGASKSSFILKMIGGLVRFIYKRCDLLLIQSEAFKASVLQWGGAEEKVVYVPNWGITSATDSEVPSWVQNLPTGFRVVFAGNLGKAQDLQTIVAAAACLSQLKEIQFIIVGDGSEKQRLEEEVEKRHLSQTVHLVGRKPPEDMPGLFAQSDVLLVTLTNEPIFALTIPSKLQSYMASGKPLLASMNGEGARIVQEAGAGLCCPPASPQLMADKIVELFNMEPGDRLALGLQGQLYFRRHFEQSIVVQQIEDACRSVIEVPSVSTKEL